MCAPYGLSGFFRPRRVSNCNESAERSISLLETRPGAVSRRKNDCDIVENHALRAAIGCRCCPHPLKPRCRLRTEALRRRIDCMHRHEHACAAPRARRARIPARERVELLEILYFQLLLAIFGGNSKIDAVLGWVPVRARRDAESSKEDGPSRSVI